MNAGRVRHLPLVRPQWQRSADVVVVGSGAAGISAALAAAGHGLRVLLLSKQALDDGATPLAQGGLAAAIGPGDDAAQHEQDTLAAGAGLCEPAAVAALAAHAPAEIARLARLGARLEAEPLHLEGGHRHPRIVHAGGDAAGAEVHRALVAALLASPVEILTGAVALDALIDARGAVGGLLIGLVQADGQTLRPGAITAPAVVLATGGFGQAFATTTSPAGLTGDGVALAARAGAELRDVEFVQFHPTVLWQPAASGQCPLITEALRGAGAVLVDAVGRPVMAGLHPLGDLAPRDVVAAAMRQRMDRGDGPADHLWLDATHLGRRLETAFPTVTARCRERGIDPVTQPIPVAPGAHYSCGGILADLDGRTSVPGLLAIGEAASTGVHGANRLASNSLTESLIAGRRAGALLARKQPRPTGPHSAPEPGLGARPADRAALAAAMSRHAGVIRDRAGLEHLLDTLAQAGPGDGELTLALVEATSLHAVSTLITMAALARAESRGCHRWAGLPAVSDGQAEHTLLLVHQQTGVVSVGVMPAGTPDAVLTGVGGAA
ncbi:MAG TPA: L-aspartate oxidase [Streptosporangiaceae bacterium]|jgi:L-aspartate oxidase|nr:L-aspartate oxidase [Streptosporangiaceae bacterium]